MVNLMDCSKNEFTNQAKSKKLYCFGAGRKLQVFADDYYGIAVEGVIDNNCYKDKAFACVNGKNVPVISPMEFAKELLLALNVASEEKVSEWYNFHKLGFYTAPMPKM